MKPMAKPRNHDLRTRVFALAVSGCAPVLIAERLSISLSLADYYVRRLVNEKALERVGKSTPALYRRGPACGTFEQSLSESLSGSPNGPQVFAHQDRVDRAWFTVSITRPPPPDWNWWEKEWTFGTTTCRFKRLVLSNGRLASIEVQNNKTAVIKIEPFALGPDDIGRADAIAYGYATEVVHLASKSCKMALGLPLPIDGMTVAHDIPSLRGRPVGKIPVTDTSEIDDSPRGRPEWETRDLEEAVAQHQAGRRILWLEERVSKALASIDERLARGETVSERMAVALERLATQHATLAERILRIIEPTAREYAPPPEDKEDHSYG